MPTSSNIFKVKVDTYTVSCEVIKLHLSKKFVKVNVRCFQKRCTVFRATKSTEPILKKRDELFALARILRLRQARPDNYWLLNSAPARRSQKSAAMPGPPAAVTVLLCRIVISLAFCRPRFCLSLTKLLIKKKEDRKDVCKNAKRRKYVVETAILFEAC